MGPIHNKELLQSKVKHHQLKSSLLNGRKYLANNIQIKD